MSSQNLLAEPDTDITAGAGTEQATFDDMQFDEEALRARRRQYATVAAAIAIAAAAILAFPWRDHLRASGRVAPQRWARVRAEAPGVVREVTRKSGDAVEEGAVIAVLDSDEQGDALETARLALARERDKLADVELRLRENDIQREGAAATARAAGARANAAQRIDDSRIAALDPAANAALEGARGFATDVRAELTLNRSAHAEGAFRGEDLHRKVREAMARYSEGAAAVADQLTKVVGPEAARQFRFELEDLQFAYDLADQSMEEILTKQGLVARGLLAAVALREPSIELERETMELAHNFRAVSGSARAQLGSSSDQSERVRGAEESRRLLASESERLQGQRASATSEVAAAELAVRAAERNQGKTIIRAPIRGKLSGESLARFDAVSANTSVGVVEDAKRLVLKVHVEPGDLRRIKVGQMVESRSRGGRALRGSVVWATPFAGQQVRDQAWNVLIQLDGDYTGVDVGEQVTASIDVGRRSLLGRWLAPADEPGASPRIALVEDPTEVHEIPAVLPESSAAEREKLAAAERPRVSSGLDGG